MQHEVSYNFHVNVANDLKGTVLEGIDLEGSVRDSYSIIDGTYKRTTWITLAIAITMFTTICANLDGGIDSVPSYLS